MALVLAWSLIRMADELASLVYTHIWVNQLIGLVAAVFVAGYLIWVSLKRRSVRIQGWKLELPGLRLSLGQILIGGAAAAIGLFASTLTRSQLVAIVVGAAIVVVMLVFWVLAQAIDPPLNKFLAAAALHHANFRPFQFGILELGAVAYYLSVAYLFLLGAVKILEARRWR